MLTTVFAYFITSCFAITNLFNVNFNSGGFPSGWTTYGTAGNWSVSSTANAGGTSPELKFGNIPTGAGIRRFISPAINTTNYFELVLQFDQYLQDDPGTSDTYTVGVEVSSDLTNWTNIWGWPTSDNYGPERTTLYIPSDYLNTTTFYVAFYFEGLPGNLQSWSIDNITLDVSRMAVFGTWSGTHYLTEDVGVPVGKSLVIQPGTQVIAQTSCGIVVSGSMRAEGTTADSIRFTATNHTEGWKGIYYYSSDVPTDLIAFKHCIFEWGNGFGDSAVLYVSYIQKSLLIQDCRFSNNYSNFVAALGVGSPNDVTVDRCLFKNNTSYMYSAMRVASSGIINVSNCRIMHNQLLSDNYTTHVGLTANSYESQLVMDSNTFADNSLASATCRIEGVSSMQMYFTSIQINNSIFYNPENTTEIYFWSSMNHGNPTINYSDIYNNATNGLFPVESNCIWSNPIFSSNANCTLSGGSPCVDSGNPALTDPDGSRKDMGALPLWKKPTITYVKDIPNDQGHKVKIRWSRSQADTGGYASGYYSVFRVDNARSADGHFIDSPLQLNGLSSSRDVWWHFRDTDYNWIGNVPAFNFTNYSLDCSTLEDSSYTGTHAATYVVVYSYSTWFSVSDEVSGYSVDNIPPDAARDLMIVKQNGQVYINWSPVTCGTYNGNNYPELNGIAYKVYAGDTADFPLNSSTYVMTTVNPYSVCNVGDSSRKFFCIKVTDQP